MIHFGQPNAEGMRNHNLDTDTLENTLTTYQHDQLKGILVDPNWRLVFLYHGEAELGRSSLFVDFIRIYPIRGCRCGSLYPTMWSSPVALKVCALFSSSWSTMCSTFFGVAHTVAWSRVVLCCQSVSILYQPKVPTNVYMWDDDICMCRLVVMFFVVVFFE